MGNRPSFPLVYTMNGTYVGALFHGQCDKCNTKYFPNYKIQSAGQRIFIDVQQEGSGYHQRLCLKHLLKDISNNIWVTGATFQSRAKVYNLNFKEKDTLRLPQLQEFARTSDGEWD